MKINIKPAGYLIMGGNKFVDQVSGNSFEQARRQAYGRADGSRVEPLHPQSLVLELAEVLAQALDLLEIYEVRIEGEWGIGRDIDELELADELPEPITDARALLSRITGGSAS